MLSNSSCVRRYTSVIIMIVLGISVAVTTGESIGNEFTFSACQAGKETCQDCYLTLVQALLGNDENVFQLSRMFTTPDHDEPSFVIVNYHFHFDDNAIEDEIHTWFWAQSKTYFLHPLFIFQFITLFFGNPQSIYEREVNITINATECHRVRKDHMLLLTQRVSLNINHYDGLNQFVSVAYT